MCLNFAARANLGRPHRPPYPAAGRGPCTRRHNLRNPLQRQGLALAVHFRIARVSKQLCGSYSEVTHWDHGTYAETLLSLSADLLHICCTENPWLREK